MLSQKNLGKLPAIKNDAHSPIGTTGERIGVVGAGIGGVITALELADKGYDVVLVEAGSGIMQATSGHNGRNIHLGFQYPLDTTGESARKCMEMAIQFHSKYGQFGGKVRNVFIASQHSLITPEQYRDYCKQMQSIYAAFPKEKQVFGPPENFYRELTAEEYSPYIKPGAVDAGFVTSEQNIDLEALRTYFEEQLAKHGKKITVLYNTRVAALENKGDSFTLHAQDGPGKVIFPIQVHQLVNAGWVYSKKMTEGEREGLDSNFTFRSKPMLIVRGITPDIPSAHSLISYDGASITHIGNGDYIAFASPSHESVITIEEAEKALDKALGENTGPGTEGIIISLIDTIAKTFPGFAGAYSASELHTSSMETHGDVHHTLPESEVHRRSLGWGSAINRGPYHELQTGKLTGAVEAARQATEGVMSYSQMYNIPLYLGSGTSTTAMRDGDSATVADATEPSGDHVTRHKKRPRGSVSNDR